MKKDTEREVRNGFSERKAQKDHKCLECGHQIQKGNIYIYLPGRGSYHSFECLRIYRGRTEPESFGIVI